MDICTFQKFGKFAVSNLGQLDIAWHSSVGEHECLVTSVSLFLSLHLHVLSKSLILRLQMFTRCVILPADVDRPPPPPLKS
jgi:hypothetical protein